jgi:hypothetical protein
MPGGALAYFILAWTFSVIALVGYKLAIGQINLVGLLSNSDGSFAPERAQLFLTTAVALVTFAQDSLTKGTLQDVSNINLILSGFAGSQFLYVAGKYVRQLLAGSQHGRE